MSDQSVHAVVGPTGAGKSALLNAINGFVPISAGTVSLEYQDLSSMLNRQLTETPTTVLIMEHCMDVVQAVATDATVLTAGKVVRNRSGGPSADR